MNDWENPSITARAAARMAQRQRTLAALGDTRGVCVRDLRGVVDPAAGDVVRL